MAGRDPKVVIELDDDKFGAVLRHVLLNPVSAEQIYVATKKKLTELGLKPDVDFAVGDLPSGSNQSNTGSILDWVAKITADDSKAQQQLLILNATAATRTDLTKFSDESQAE